MANILSLKNVSISYQSGNYRKQAVLGLDLEVSRGEVFGFLGPNGAGKTSTIKAILDLIPVSSGEIRISGEPAKNVQARKKIGYMPEIANYYWYLTPRELLGMYAGICGVSGKVAREKIRALIELVELQESENVLMKYFSKGMMQKVSLAQALVNDPDFLILDEPTSGLDPIAKMKVRDIIKNLKESGKTIFFSSHELSEVELICDRVGILRQGRMLKIAKMSEVLNEKSSGQSLENYFWGIITKT